MNVRRRNFFQGIIGMLIGLKASALAQSHPRLNEPEKRERTDQANAHGGFLSVHAPDLPKLPYRMEGGVKVFHLVAEPVKREFLPGKVFDVWGFNGSMPGPTIEVTEGDTVRITVDNHLPELTSVHWHGLEVPIEMDGVPGVTQDPIPPGGRFVYQFTLHQKGTFFYHSHMPMQEMMGMIGLFIIHPKKAYLPHVDKDFAYILQEWAILPNNTVPNTLSMEFNWLTLNGKVGPATTPLIVRHGDRVRIRFVNLGMDHHPIHLHGHQFYVTGTEGGRIPRSAQYPGNTVLVGVAQARDFEFEAKYVGDWMLHCHLPHHMMNQMVSMVGPMAHVGSGMHSGMGMQEGMGIVRKAHALSEDLGPGLGRGMGLATRERPVSALVGLQAKGEQMRHGSNSKPDNEKQIPGFPQDMWMTMDATVAKPETYGLRRTWTGGVMGMMTLVRILPPKMYDKIMAMIKEGKMGENQKSPTDHHHYQ